MTNEQEQFGLVRLCVHWGIAALLIVQIPLAWYMIELPDGPDKLSNYSLHKSIGMLLFAIAVFRLVWSLLSKRPPLPAETPLYEKVFAKLAQIILYVIVILMPVTGWLMTNAFGDPVSVFDVLTLPDLVEADKEFARGMRNIHLLQSYILLTVLGFHVIGALKHGFVDQNNVLYSMLPLQSLKNDNQDDTE